MFGLGMTEILVLLLLGVLLFGKKLPEVGRSVGKMLVELKKGVSGFEEHLESGNFNARSELPSPPPPRPPQRIAPTTQKFEDGPPAGPAAPSSPIV